MAKYPVFLLAFLILLAATLVALSVGRYPVPVTVVFQALAHKIGLAAAPTDKIADVVVLTARLPRIVAAVLIGSALSLGGAAYQSVFRNPLVSPGLLGVLVGAGFGLALGILFDAPVVLRILLTFAGGSAAVVIGVIIAGLFTSRESRSVGNANILLLVFGGLISTALFTSLLSLAKLAADPVNQLPDIVFWLLGSLSSIETAQVVELGPILIVGCAILLYLGRYLDILTLGDDEAKSLGISAGSMRLGIIAAATATSALTVALAGTIGWVGLIVPHIARLLVGPTHGRLLLMSMCVGSIFVLVCDTLARSVTTSELPIGVFSDLIGVVLFVVLLPRIRRGWL